MSKFETTVLAGEDGIDVAGREWVKGKCVAHWYQCCQCKMMLDHFEQPGTLISVLRGSMCPDCCKDNSVKFTNASAVTPRVEIPPAYCMASWHDVGRSLGNRIGEWPTKGTPFLFFIGNNGSGKTYASFAIIKHRAKSGVQIDYEVGSSLRSRWLASDHESSRQRVIRGVAACPFLILDDMARAGSSEGWVTAIYDILDERIREQRPTIFVSDKTPNILADMFDRAIATRLQRFTVVGFGATRR